MICAVCGDFIVTEEAWEDHLDPCRADAEWWTKPRRSALAHALRTRSGVPVHPRHTKLPMITTAMIEAFKRSGGRLPTPPEQVRNVIRTIGDYSHDNGVWYEKPPTGFYAIIGASDPTGAAVIVKELKQRGIVVVDEISEQPYFCRARLTLEGWEEWERLHKGTAIAGRGVIAMQFGDIILDKLVEDVIKPAVASIEGLSVHRIDDPEIARAGVIDNLMRETIRDAAFLIADLSHANHGAYWEAGFAEGLDKPVIYLCERSKWDSERTHFDTNHCTTLIWEQGAEDKLARQLIATLRNSLRRFERGKP